MHRIYDDADILALIRERQPWLATAYSRMWPVERADLFRYLVLYEFGGVYSDVDVSATVPCDQWATEARYLPGATSLLVGVEKATERPDWKATELPTYTHLPHPTARPPLSPRCDGCQKHYARRFQLVQWTIAATPRHPVLHRLLKMIAAYIETHRAGPPTECPDDIMESTGPGIFSDAVLGYLDEILGITVVPGAKDSVTKDGKLALAMRGVVRKGFHTPEVHILPQVAFSDGSGGVLTPTLTLTLTRIGYFGRLRGCSEPNPWAHSTPVHPALLTRDAVPLLHERGVQRPARRRLRDAPF